MPALVGIPVATALALLRYRLYDVDLIIHRALVYGVLTAAVVAIYVLTMGGLGTVMQTHGNPIVSLLATGIVAVAFQPLRAWVQRAANRLLYGQRDEPYTVLSWLGERLAMRERVTSLGGTATVTSSCNPIAYYPRNAPINSPAKERGMTYKLAGRGGPVAIGLGLLLIVVGAVAPHPVGAQTMPVTIQGFAFHPDPMTVPLGSTVTWTNQDTAPHTATSDTGVWDTGRLATGQSGSFTFNQAGSFPYHCSIHPNMHGTIVVQAAATAGPATGTTSVVGPTATSIPLSAYPVRPPARPHSLSKAIVAKEVKAGYVFSPKQTTIKVGTRVTWTNLSDAPHTVTSKTRGWKYDRTFASNRRVTFVFRKAGTYTYYCTIHPYMVARIVAKP